VGVLNINAAKEVLSGRAILLSKSPSVEIYDANVTVTAGFSGTTHSNGPARSGPPIPGPLGIESASLKGKVALVTGAGTFQPLMTAF
jgi:hypothetical protein